MSVLDLDKLLGEVSAEAPCGEDLEYDPVFMQMEQAAAGKPEQQMGDTVNPPEPPNWKEVRKAGLGLFERTRDLRVATQLTNALLHTDGMAGLADGLGLVRGLLQRYWEPVHPQLDPDDDNDPTMRVNVIASLCDPESSLRWIQEVPLVASRAIGKFSLRDIHVANGTTPVPEGGEVPDMAAIEAAFLDCDVADLEATAAAIGSSIENIEGVDAALSSTVGTSQAPDLSSLPAVLREAQKVVAEQLGRRGVATEGAEGTDAAAAGGAAAPGAAISGEIRSREDVIRVLDKSIDYFARNEPSSPVPLLLRRAKRLISKDFMEILRDLASDGVSQAETVTGATTEE